MEVMGLMLGQFVDDYTITCVDVFAMPQVCEVVEIRKINDGYSTGQVLALKLWILSFKQIC